MRRWRMGLCLEFGVWSLESGVWSLELEFGVLNIVDGRSQLPQLIQNFLRLQAFHEIRVDVGITDDA
jgi:hypothetical protein